MKLQRQSIKNKSILFITLATICIMLAVGFLYFYPKTAPRSNARSSASDAPATKANLPTVKGGEQNTSPKESGASPQSPGAEASPYIALTALNQNGSTLQIRTLIQSVMDDGACSLQLSNGNRTLYRTVKTQPLANSSTCAGFDVETSELYPGDWSVKISLTYQGKTSELSSMVTIR